MFLGHIILPADECSFVSDHQPLLMTIVTGFTKMGLPHTSTSMNLKDCNKSLMEYANLKFLSSVNLHSYSPYCPNFKAIAVFNQKLWLVN